MKNTQKTVATAEMPKSRYTELKQMLDERRREIQAEVQGKMRDVRDEGTWGGKLNEVLDAVESSEADIQEDIEFALDPDEVGDAQQDQRRAGAARAGRLRQLLRVRRGDRREASARAALRRPLQGLRRGARDRRAARASARGAARHVARSSSTCKHPASQRFGAPPVAEPVAPHRRSPTSDLLHPRSHPGVQQKRGRA